MLAGASGCALVALSAVPLLKGDATTCTCTAAESEREGARSQRRRTHAQVLQRRERRHQRCYVTGPELPWEVLLQPRQGGKPLRLV